MKNNKLKSLLAGVMALTMLCGMLVLPAPRANAEEIKTYGENLVFNCGTSYLTTGSTLIKALTMETVDDNYILYAFSIYSMSGGNRSLGHVRRRILEAKMYLYADYTGTMPDKVGYVIYDPCGGKNVSGNGTYNVQGYNTELTAQPITATR